MSDRWAASIPLDRTSEALRLWKEPAIQVCATSDRLWLRGPAWSDALDREVRAMLGSERFALDDDGLITPLGCSLFPVADLPGGIWTPLTDWFRLAPPPRHFTARQEDRASLTLQPSNNPRPTSLLLVPLVVWREYAETAPAVRLKQWSFAVCDDQRLLVRGAPPPPFPGAHFVEFDGIAVPAGWTWSPPLDAKVLRRTYGLDDGDIVLLTPNGTYEKVTSDQFVGATRSAVRLTAKELAC